MKSCRRRDPLTDSDAILERLMRLHPKVIDLTLERVETLLARLGHPERNLPPTIHVAGTNAKGSVIAFMRAILEAAGLRVHVYTSPHLVRFNERIRLAGSLISDDALAAVLEECERVNAGDPITYFEITTAAAYLAFSRSEADVLLLETGLGGRLDATNVLEKPALTVLTPISMDHQQFLGDTLGEIIGEKLGIVKAGVPCLSAKQERREEKKVIARIDGIGAPLSLEGRDWFVRKGRDGMILETLADGGKTARTFPLPSLAGGHQIRNAGLAIAALDRLDGFDIPDSAIALGLQSARWPARMQRLERGPLVDLLPDGWELWLDGGHNGAAAKMIAAQARTWRDRPLHLIFGMINSKDPGEFLGHLEGRIGLFRGVSIPGEDATLSADEVCRAARDWRMDADPADGVEAALKDITGQPGPARVLIAGSLYLAGTVLRENE